MESLKCSELTNQNTGNRHLVSLSTWYLHEAKLLSSNLLLIHSRWRIWWCQLLSARTIFRQSIKILSILSVFSVSYRTLDTWRISAITSFTFIVRTHLVMDNNVWYLMWQCCLAKCGKWPVTVNVVPRLRRRGLNLDWHRYNQPLLGTNPVTITLGSVKSTTFSFAI